jgi:hypothetical protein
MSKSKNRRPISVSGPTYDRLREAVDYGDLAGFVDDAVRTAFEDPKVLAKIVDKCRHVDDAELCPRSR